MCMCINQRYSGSCCSCMNMNSGSRAGSDPSEHVMVKVPGKKIYAQNTQLSHICVAFFLFYVCLPNIFSVTSMKERTGALAYPSNANA